MKNDLARAWRLKNPEKVKLASKKFAASHRDELNARHRARMTKGKCDFREGIDSKESRYYVRQLECTKRSKLNKELADANSNNAAIWLSLGIYE